MKKIALFLVAAALFSGCSKEPTVTLFGVTLGDSVNTKDTGNFSIVEDEGRYITYSFSHTPEFCEKDNWEFCCSTLDGTITSICGVFSTNDVSTLNDRFEKCKKHILKFPGTEISNDSDVAIIVHKDFISHGQTNRICCCRYKVEPTINMFLSNFSIKDKVREIRKGK